MRRPLSAELSADDRSLAQRWAIRTASVYWTIAIVLFGAMLASSGAEKATVVAKAERTGGVQDRFDARPYGSLPNIAMPACGSSQTCKTSDAGRMN